MINSIDIQRSILNTLLFAKIDVSLLYVQTYIFSMPPRTIILDKSSVVLFVGLIVSDAHTVSSACNTICLINIPGICVGNWWGREEAIARVCQIKTQLRMSPNYQISQIKLSVRLCFIIPNYATLRSSLRCQVFPFIFFRKINSSWSTTELNWRPIPCLVEERRSKVERIIIGKQPKTKGRLMESLGFLAHCK